MDGARTMDHGWTETMKASLTKNRTKLIETFAGSMPRIMDLLVEGGVFPDTDDIMNNTSLDTPKKRARRLLDDIPKKPARDYWTLVLSLYDEQAALGHMAEKILSTYEAKGGRIRNTDVRRARQDYQEYQRNGRRLFVSLHSSAPQPQQPQPPPSPPQQQQPSSPEQPEGVGSLPFRTPVQECQMQPDLHPQMEFQIPVWGPGTFQLPGSTPVQEQQGTQSAAQHEWRSETNQVLTVDSESQAAGYGGSQEPMETDADQHPAAAQGHGGARPRVPIPANIRGGGDGTTETKYQKKRRKYPDRVYKMESNPRGVAFIIDIEKFDDIGDRPGSENDCRLLVDLLRNVLHFHVLPVEKNLTGKEMKRKLFEFSQNKRLLSTVDSCLVIILSHGYIGDIIFGKDGNLDANNLPVKDTYVSSRDLRNWFCTSGCSALAGKPKLFIFQACRGVKEDTNFGHIPVAASSRARIDFPGLEMEQERNQADFSDMYFLYPTIDDFVAYRGTFIPTLVNVFRQHSHEMHVKDMASEVHRQMTQRPLFVERGPAGVNTKKFATPEERGNLPKMWFLNPPHS